MELHHRERRKSRGVARGQQHQQDLAYGQRPRSVPPTSTVLDVASALPDDLDDEFESSDSLYDTYNMNDGEGWDDYNNYLYAQQQQQQKQKRRQNRLDLIEFSTRQVSSREEATPTSRTVIILINHRRCRLNSSTKCTCNPSLKVGVKCFMT